MNYRCWIVDDEKAAHKALLLALKNHSEFEIVEHFYAIDQLPFSELDTIDVVFLDIEMPRASGFSLFERWQGKMPLIVFVTAYSQYALKAFKNHAFGYLLKPIEQEQFSELSQRLKIQLEQASFFAQKEQLKDANIERLIETKFLAITSDQGIIKLKANEIIYCQSVKDFVAIKLQTQEVLTRSTLKAFTEKLEPTQFIQIHRSFVVNISFITSLTNKPFGDASIRLSNGEELAVSRHYKKVLLQKLKTLSTN